MAKTGEFKNQRPTQSVQGLLEEGPVDQEALSTGVTPALTLGTFAPPLDPGHASSVTLAPRIRGIIPNDSELYC